MKKQMPQLANGFQFLPPSHPFNPSPPFPRKEHSDAVSGRPGGGISRDDGAAWGRTGEDATSSLLRRLETQTAAPQTHRKPRLVRMQEEKTIDARAVFPGSLEGIAGCSATSTSAADSPEGSEVTGGNGRSARRALSSCLDLASSLTLGHLLTSCVLSLIPQDTTEGDDTQQLSRPLQLLLLLLLS